MTTHDRDTLIRAALAPPADVRAPADLGDAVYREVLATPQRSGAFRLGRIGTLPAPSPLLTLVGLLTLLALVLVIVALSRTLAPPVLAMYHGGPDRTGVMPGPGPAGEPVIDWDEARPGALPFNTMPLPAGDRLIVGDTGGFLAALDTAMGSLRWELDVGSPIRGAPALAADLVVVGTDAGDVVAVRVRDGSEAWRQPLGGAVRGSPLVVDGVLYVGSADGTLAALDPMTGKTSWSIDVGDAITRGAAFADGVVYVGATGGRFTAIEVATRSVRWRAELGPGEVGTPTVGGGRVFVGRGILSAESTRDLVALRTVDGEIDWTFPSPFGEQVHMGGLADGRVYAVSEDHHVRALDEATGAVLWDVDTGGRVGTLAAIVGDVVYVASEDRAVRAIDARTGIVLWRVPVTGIPTMAAVIDGRVFVGTDLGRVVAIGGTPATGSP